MYKETFTPPVNREPLHQIPNQQNPNQLMVKQETVRRNSTGNIDMPQAKQLTLLEKAELFHKKYSKKYRAQQEQRKKRAEELLGKAKQGSFMRKYHEKVIDERKQSLQMEELRKLEPRKIIVNIQSCKCGEADAVYKDMATFGETSEVRECSVFQFQANENRREASDVCDLLVTVKIGFNIHNGLESDDDRMEKCRVKMFMYPDHEKRDTVRRSSYRFLTVNGVTRWDHSFIVKGARRCDLEQRYFLLEIEGEKYGKKAPLGQVLISGDEATVKDKIQHRYAVDKEKQLLTQALQNPGTDFSTTLDLNVAEEALEISLGTRILRELAIDKSPKKQILRKGALKSPMASRRASMAPERLTSVEQQS